MVNRAVALIIRKTCQLWWFNWLDYGTEILLLAAPSDKFLSHCSQILAGDHMQIIRNAIGAVELKVLTSQTHTYKFRIVWYVTKDFCSGRELASHAGVFGGARFSSLPNRKQHSFPLFYLRGKWPIKVLTGETRLRRDPRVTVFLLFFPSLRLCSAWSILKFD